MSVVRSNIFTEIDLEAIKGDTFSPPVIILLGGLDLSSFHEAILTVRKRATDIDTLLVLTLDAGIQIETTIEDYEVISNDITLYANYADMEIPEGVYVYDMQVKEENEKYTILCGKFTIFQDVT